MKSPLLALLLLPLAVQFAAAESPPTSFTYVLQADALAKTKAAAIAQFAACERDWIVLDAAFSTGAPWESADLAAIRKGRAGRKIIAYLSIGEAEDYRPYWRKEWLDKNKLSAAAPAWLGAENPEWKGNFRVKYWHADWQRLILSAVDDTMAHGFDGVYLDIVDGFETYEQNGREYVDDRQNPATKQSYRRDMIDWVKTIAARARTKNAAALVIPQNGSQLLAQPDFLSTISAIGIEDLFTEGNKLQPASHTVPVLKDLALMTAAHKPVLLIEYAQRADRQTLAQTQSHNHGFTWLLTDRQLKTIGESGR